MVQCTSLLVDSCFTVLANLQRIKEGLGLMDELLCRQIQECRNVPSR